MKKFLLCVAILATCIGLIGCGNTETQNEEVNNTRNESSNVSSSVENNSSSNNQEETNTITEEDWETIKSIDSEYAEDVEESLSDVSMTDDGSKYVVNIGDEVTAYYYHDGEKITGYEVRAKYESREEAILAKTDFEVNKDTDEDYQNVESVEVQGDELVVKYGPEEYKDLTLEEIKQTYDFLNMLQGIE